VCVISTEDEDVDIRLPLAAVGAQKPSETADLFGRELLLTPCDSYAVSMQVKAHQSYLFRCNIL
jgi:hypothetical protein